MSSRALKPQDVTPTQYNVLRILRGAEEKGLCRSEIMERVITRVPDTTRLLDRMEAPGLMARARDAADRRFISTRIMDEGLRLVGAAEESVTALPRGQFTTLEGEDLRQLVRLLEFVRDRK